VIKNELKAGSVLHRRQLKDDAEWESVKVESSDGVGTVSRGL